MTAQDLISRIPSPLSNAEKDLIERAYLFSEKKHEGQQRNSGEPYFSHSIAVARYCIEFGMDVETIAAALLHDVLEDTDATEEDIQERFGESVLFLVKGVTKLGTLKYQGRERHVESMRKFFVAMAEDIRVLIIKLADRLHNVSTLDYVSKEKQKRIALETIEVHAALAGRLGMEHLKGLLEDYAFPYVLPEEYERTKKIMAQIVPEAQKTIAYAHTEVQKVIQDFSINGADVSSRIKHVYSTYKKLDRYNWNTDLVYDIVALRVLTETIADCYQVLGLVHMLWKPIPKRIKDYIALPKPNGYRSLHTTVITDHGIVEIQIRTHEMHEEAEMGVASHVLYKERNLTASPSTRQSFNWLEELKELHQSERDSNIFLEHLHMDFFKNRIFVFSPKGDVIDLPEGATAIDFAYAIHSDIGDSTHAARANGKIIALSDPLHNGDIVEIMTSKRAKPSTKWLEYAKSNMARRKIRSSLKLDTNYE
ncbi:MAG TPA: RelA/SpoT family protein [Candidatus Paceibacterota bacterium]|nr:RelA/SpoT family protein [Candidatus Paceibacterota bacterium]